MQRRLPSFEEIESQTLEQRRTFAKATSASQVSADSLKHLKDKHVLDEKSLKVLRFFHLLARNWSLICGRRLTRHLRPLGIEGQTLWVEASSGLWVEQASLYEEELLSRLHSCLPRIQVTRMRFRTGRFFKTEAEQAKARKLSQGPRNYSEEALKLIELIDPET